MNDMPNDHFLKEDYPGEGNRSQETVPPSVQEKLEQIYDILQRMLALAVSSASPDAADRERAALQQELDRLRGEIDCIADTLPQPDSASEME